MHGRNLRCSAIGSSCQSTATSYDCTARLVIAAICSAIEESDLYLFLPLWLMYCSMSIVVKSILWSRVKLFITYTWSLCRHIYDSHTLWVLETPLAKSVYSYMTYVPWWFPSLSRCWPGRDWLCTGAPLWTLAPLSSDSLGDSAVSASECIPWYRPVHFICNTRVHHTSKLNPGPH